MTKMKQLDKILKDYKNGKITLAQAKKEAGNISLVKLAHTKVDLQRQERTGAGEVIYGAGTTTKQILEIAETLLANGQNVLATRLSTDAINAIKEKYPNKTIWLYTGYRWEEIWHYPMMKYIDVVVDGEFVIGLKDTKLLWKGSSNQRVIDVKETLKNTIQSEPVLHCGDYE